MKKIVILLLTTVIILHAKDYTLQKWQVLDMNFSVQEKVKDPLYMTIGAEFIHSSGTVMTIPGFYNDNQEWIIRFCPDLEGNWAYTTYASLPELAGKRGVITVKRKKKKDEHGPITICEKNPQKFLYADGTPYFLTAFECDWLYALDAENPDDIPRTEQMIRHIKDNKFNQIVMNIYTYDANWGDKDKMAQKYLFDKPKVFPFGGSNDKPDYSTLNIDFFKRLDRVIEHLDEAEIISHLMIYVWNKKVNWPEPGSKADNRYFDYVVKRYQAYPNLIWDISKEALAYGRDDMEYITERIDRLRKLDGHQRLLSVHDYAYCDTYPDKVDFISIQEWRPNLYSVMRDVAKKHATKPVFNIEHGGYEKTMHMVFTGPAFNDPKTCLDRNYQCIFAGTYSTYYWQNASWYEVIYEPEKLPKQNQPNFHWYKHMIEFFERYNFNQLDPYQGSFTPYCLTNNDDLYIFYATKMMERLTGDMKALKGKSVTIKWFDPYTGKYLNGGKREFVGSWLGIDKPEELKEQIAVGILEIVK
ncbi:MAG: DUF4038 domain-containing protein [Fidelibacterota bacterium]